MATGPGYPGGFNTFVPAFGHDPEGAGGIIIAYSRNPKRFRIAEYAQYVPAPRTLGYYLKLYAQEAGRVVNVDDFIWPDGAEAPSGADGQEKFDFLPFTCIRHAYPFALGDLATDQASWPIIEQHSAIHAAQLMTARTYRMMTVLTTAANWQTTAAGGDDLSANHTDSATNIGGGKWDAGSSTAPYIKKALDAIAVLVTKDTLAVVGGEPDIFSVVVSPTTARLMAESAEIHDYIKGSYWAKQEIESGESPNARYGLPSSIYGYRIIVENAVRVSSRKEDTLARSFAMPDQAALFLSRIGGIEGTYGAPSFSTATMFYYQDELTVETKHDVDNRRTVGRCVENTAEVLTAPASGYYLTAVTS
jgi:hypothetical protein